MQQNFVRTLLVVCGVFLVIFLAEFFFEWWRLGWPGVAEMSWADVNNAKMADVLSPTARAYNNMLAMLLGTIGLAIPLTANMHTPKLIDMFLRDRLNKAVLYLVAFGAANVLFVEYLVGPKFATVWAYRFAIYFAIFGWALLIPYFFYVVRFLDPSNILHRVKLETVAVVEKVQAGQLDTELGQDQVNERIFQIGTIVLKSLDRADRGVAMEGVWTLKQLVEHHGELKARMPPAWFKVDRKDFVGFSHEALEMLNEDHTWYEMAAMRQLYFAYQQALAKTSDIVSSISDAVRAIAVKCAKRGDKPALDIAIRYFNNFVRESLKKKDTHSAYDVLYEYRLLARDLAAYPDKQRDIARYVRYYAEAARALGIPFIQHLSAFEIGNLARRAYEGSSPVARDILGEALSIPHVDGTAIAPLVVKAKLMLGAFCVQNGLADEAEQVRQNLANVPEPIVRDAMRELLSAERSFFEVTDRQENLEYVRPERRQHLETFVAQLLSQRPAPRNVESSALPG